MHCDIGKEVTCVSVTLYIRNYRNDLIEFGIKCLLKVLNFVRTEIKFKIYLILLYSRTRLYRHERD
jgi:hypothetical protein